MSFLHPEFLYYMLPPLFILFGLLLTQKEAEATFFSDEVMSKLRVSNNTLTLKARNALFMLIGVLIVIALAGPVIKEGKVEIKAKSADIMIALDISDSMLGEDIYPNRLGFAKLKAIELLKNAPNERIGVIAFAKNSYLVSPLSFDHAAVEFLLRKLDTDSITEKGTDFLSMLEVVGRSVQKESKKYLLILSDGGDSDDFSKEISFARERNIAVFVLGIGTTKGAPIKQKNGEFIKYKGDIIISKLNENIATLATKTGGVYIESVKSDKDIKMMLSEIEKYSVKKELKSQEIVRYIPLFYYPLGLALLILLIATSSMSKRKEVPLPSVFLLFGLLFSSVSTEAGILDFMDLKEAKQAYEKGDYEKSAQIYQKYAEQTQDPHAYFNAGNAFYKQKKYKEAVQLYEKAVFQEPQYKANKLGNLGNAYAKQGTQEDLLKAKKYYEESLKLIDDEDIKKNLEEVKKRIQEQKQEDKKDSKNKEDEKKGDTKEESKESNESSKDKQESSKNSKEDKEKSEEDKEKSEEDKEKSDKEEDSSKSKDSKDKQKNSDERKSEKESQESKNQENNETKQEQKKEKLKELDKREENISEPDSQEAMAQKSDKQEMSDAEEAKWLQELNRNQNTFMYMLNNQEKKKENLDEKPW